MDPGLATVIAAVGAALVAGLSAWSTRRQAAQAKRHKDDAAKYAQAQIAEGEAYKRARVIDDQVVARLQAEVEDLEEQTAALREQLAQERGVSTALRARVWDLERTVNRMRRILVENGLNGDPDHTPIEE